MFCIICIFVWWLYVRDCHDFVKFVDAWLHDQVLQSLDSCWQLPRAKFRDVTVGPFDHCRSSHPHQLFGKKRLLETVYNCWWNSVLHSILLQWWLKHLVHFILYIVPFVESSLITFSPHAVIWTCTSRFMLIITMFITIITFMELTTWTVPWRPNMVSWVRLRWLLLPISSFRDLAQNLTTTVSTILTLRYFEYPFSLPHVPSVFSLSHSVNLHAAARRVRWFRRAEASWAKGWGGSRVATGRDHPPTTEAVWCQRTKVRGVSSGGDGFQCLSADTVCICCFFLGSRVLDQPAQMKIWQEPSLWSMASRDLEWIKWVTLLNSSSNLSLFFRRFVSPEMSRSLKSAMLFGSCTFKKCSHGESY